MVNIQSERVLAFTKMHGLGNDFMMVDGVTQAVDIRQIPVERLAHRQFGIGFDQLLLVEPPASGDVDFNYRIFNVDGSEVEHCGNGARCFAAFVYERGLSVKNPLRVGTVNRVLNLKTLADGQVRVNMGMPAFSPKELPFHNPEQAPSYRRTIDLPSGSVEIEFCAVSMGNPHAVIKVEDLDNTAVKEIGAALGSHPDFPEGVNVGFMQVINQSTIRLRVFERGTGETLACGTGACAAVVSGRLLKLLTETVSVNLPGGQLTIEWNNPTSPVMMTGPVSSVYQGSIKL
jgi:diaminopimelate epimerase